MHYCGLSAEGKTLRSSTMFIKHNGKLDEAINQVNHDGTTNMLAFVIIGPNRYEVKGDTLTDC